MHSNKPRRRAGQVDKCTNYHRNSALIGNAHLLFLRQCAYVIFATRSRRSRILTVGAILHHIPIYTHRQSQPSLWGYRVCSAALDLGCAIAGRSASSPDRCRHCDSHEAKETGV